ncbi:Nucleolar protein 4 [Liparis tanakae]|uniref:Nucleolar protein 4 n=1 Tax=Liparis tanakae TaxID=230148 RepID=A0A4Z2I832_9TELE|nr:Nucleolar protein 4 [Liparis tanakae]
MATKKACVDAPKRSRSPVVLEAEMFSEFQDWCLRTYGDSGKTKTVTRRKYNKIMQTLLQNEESDGVYIDNSHINAKFKFWKCQCAADSPSLGVCAPLLIVLGGMRIRSEALVALATPRVPSAQLGAQRIQQSSALNFCSVEPVSRTRP